MNTNITSITLIILHKFSRAVKVIVTMCPPKRSAFHWRKSLDLRPRSWAACLVETLAQGKKSLWNAG